MTFVQYQKQNGMRCVRAVVFAIACVGVLVVSAAPAQAGYWGEPTAAALMKHTMEIIRRNIEGELLGTLKMVAVQTLNRQVDQLIGGGGSRNPLFITNFEDFLYQYPAQQTELFMNDFFTLTTRGRGSSSNYVSRGGGSNYSGYLETLGRQVTTESRFSTSNLEEYTASPETMFEEGDWRAFNAFFSNPANNPYGYALQAEKVYQNKLAQEQRAAEVKAQSSGFLPSEEGGRVVTPAGTIQDIVGSVRNSPINAITSASNLSELTSGAVLSFANGLIRELVQNGLGGR